MLALPPSLVCFEQPTAQYQSQASISSIAEKSQLRHCKTQSLAMDAALSEVAALPSTSKTSAYTELLDKTLSNSSNNDSDGLASDLKKYITAAMQDTTGLVVSKQVATLFVKRLVEIKDLEARRSVAEKTLELLQDRQGSFEEQVCGVLAQSISACKLA
jgi:hypothetical protein